MRALQLRAGVLVVDGALDDGDLLQLSERAGEYHVQQLGPGRGRDGLPERREHASVDDPWIRDLLWSRIHTVLPSLPEWFPPYAFPSLDPALSRWTACGCNIRSRYYRYRKGDRFAPYFDEAFRPRPKQRTFLTLLLYLPTAEPCVGGETVIDGEVVMWSPVAWSSSITA